MSNSLDLPSPPEADIEKARKALEKFIAKFAAADYKAALKHTQASWVHTHTPEPQQRLINQMDAVVPAGYKITGWSVGILSTYCKVPEVFSDCMIDFPFSITAEGEGREYTIAGKARVICERGYMKPSPKGKWGVNPTSMSRGQRTSSPVS